MAEEKIVVSDSQISPGATTLLRYALTTVGGILVTKGFLPAGSDVNLIVGGLLIVVNTAYAMYLTYENKRKLIIVAEAAPNNVAEVERK